MIDCGYKFRLINVEIKETGTRPRPSMKKLFNSEATLRSSSTPWGNRALVYGLVVVRSFSSSRTLRSMGATLFPIGTHLSTIVG